MDYTTIQTKWIKFGKIRDFVFVGKDILATASGLHVRFIDVNTKEKRIELFDDDNRGSGVSNLSGHTTIPMFSVADKESNPTIRIFTYPRIHKISSCTSMEETNGYLSCTFAGTDYFIGLTSFPNFQLVVWLWQTGDKVFVKSTKLEDFVQTIACSPFSPHAIAQFARTTGKLSVYRICGSSKIVTLYPIEMNSLEKKLTSVCWTNDGNLLLCDEFSNVSSISADGGNRNVLIEEYSKSTRHPYDRYPFVVAFKDGLFLVNTRTNEIAVSQFYRKSFIRDSKEFWQKVWSSNNNERELKPVRAKAHKQRDSLFLHDETGQIMEITMSHDYVPRFEIVYTDGVEYKELVKIASRSSHLAAIDRFDYLNIIDSFAGQIENRISLKVHGQVVCAKAHPNLPIIFTSSITGNCLFIDASTNKPKILRCYHLQNISLDKMKFSSEGKFIGIANSTVGRIFVIGKNINDGDSSSVGLFAPNIQITDFLMYDRNDDVIKILILLTTRTNVMTGNKLILYACNVKGYIEEKIECVIDLLNHFKSLQYGPRRNVDIIGVPYLSRQLHRMEIKDDFNDLVLTEALPTMHRLKNIQVYVDRDRIITFGYDGLIVIRDNTNIRRILAIFMVHHRNEGGIRSATTINETIVSLGKNGDLMASKLCRHHVQSIDDMFSIEANSAFLNVSDVPFKADDLFYNEGPNTYLENIQKVRWEKETIEGTSARRAILLELNELKSKIKLLLDSNEKETIPGRLPISSYDLDVEYRKYKIERARLKREELKRLYDEEIEARYKICQYLRKTFWDCERVKACQLRSIFADIIVKNYPFGIVDVDVDDFRTSEGYSMEILDTISRLEEYYQSSENNNENVINKVTIERNMRSELNTIDRFYESANSDERFLLSGTSTHKWIKNETIKLTHQLKRTRDSSLNGLDKINVIRSREYLLMNHFNERFDEMRSLKGREMETAREQEERLKRCALEINSTFENKCRIEPSIIPIWHHSEIPDYVVTIIEKNEVSDIYPHVTSQDESIQEEKENFKECNLKLNSKDYDFYALALEKMMDGVLELRWEDEIKKDIPKPACLLENKGPFKLTPEEIKSQESYKIKMERLQSEREKYRSILETEMKETKDEITKRFMSFDEKLKNFEAHRTAMDSSILQEKLLRLREIRRYRRICNEDAKIARFKAKEVAGITDKVQRLVEDCSIFETIVDELKNRYESLVKRDKALEGKFPSEFGDLKQTKIEHLFRHYKRRPRIGNLACTSITYLTELGRCVITNEKSDILPIECTNYLRNLQALDSIPNNVSSLIDDIHWKTMCKLRRLKIEMEMKVRCCVVELAEAEETLAFYYRSKLAAQNKLYRSKAELDKEEIEFHQYVEDREIQLVMKMGQIEVSILGQGLDDFTDVVLISRREFLSTNEEIKKADKEKLMAIIKSVNLRKRISYQKCRHECLRYTLKYLLMESKSISEVKITRELQKYLDKVSIATNPRIEYKEIERNARAMAERYEKLLDGERERLEKITKDIIYWRESNERLTNEIDRIKLKNRESSSERQNYSRIKDINFRRKKLAVFMKRTELTKNIKENYDQLLTLHSRLESLRLRIYPTLRFNKSRLA
ncbi:cilia- and flagella-associated protein 43-like isoform X2 [Vespa velutina]|uniref:cilia- and flagella-associated protein 43-like isoform X2 n=1 Tax=Vespa velutina TaxID=202808 RepID=UPI001FB40079|nr:cilia- and flagella-associated protein 43-like isoform X2 [Vespa velutina]